MTKRFDVGDKVRFNDLAFAEDGPDLVESYRDSVFTVLKVVPAEGRLSDRAQLEPWWIDIGVTLHPSHNGQLATLEEARKHWAFRPSDDDPWWWSGLFEHVVDA